MLPRYLTSFNQRRDLHRYTDVLIIGAGIAGLRAALEVPPECEVLVVTKDRVTESNSLYAQGGIAGVLSADDRFENHVEDTLTAGDGLCDLGMVELVVREAPAQIERLIEWGTQFDLENGQPALTREGGHSHRRIVHALGDSTGREVMRAILAKVQECDHITILEEAFTLDLHTDDGVCTGALLYKSGQGLVHVHAKATILASGGCGMIYRETTNPPVATGDGMAAAYRAGAALQDMEFMQFHPTVLYVAGSARSLISEAVRGEGAYLRDVHGRRFMPEEDPRAELAPRDVVSRAIFRTMEATKHPNVYLDLAHLPVEMVRARFPGIGKVCRQFGLDITKDKIPVRPGAHYMIGGVKIDASGRTTVPGLWAAGEVTASGLHGANRLASNSLLEGLVFGAICGRNATDAVLSNPSFRPTLRKQFQLPEQESNGFFDIEDVTNSLRTLMVRKMGIVRDDQRLSEAGHDVSFWCRYVLTKEFDHKAGWELQNLLTTARLMIYGAQVRKESRGTHFRSDYPTKLPEADGVHYLVPSREELSD